jgi:S1-C subfamily serine protease
VVVRKGKERTLRAVLADPLASSTAAGALSKHMSGAVLGSISDNHPLAGHVEGIQVLDIERGSPAWSAGLRAGDIVVSVNQLPVSSMKDVAAALKRNPDALLLNVRRGDGALFIVIR